MILGCEIVEFLVKGVLWVFVVVCYSRRVNAKGVRDKVFFEVGFVFVKHFLGSMAFPSSSLRTVFKIEPWQIVSK